VRNTRRGDVLIKVSFELGDAGCLMLLAAFFVQPYPASPTLGVVIPDIHLQDRADAGKGVNHYGDERAVAQSRERAYVDGGEQGARLLTVEHGSTTLLHNVFGTTNRVCRIYLDDLVDDEPVEEHTDCGQ